MNILQIKDIEKVISSILEDDFLKKCLSEKKSITDHTKNIFDSKFILECQLIDCFIPFYIKLFPKKTYTYPQFIREAYPEDLNRSDTKESGRFEGFRENINDLKERYQNAGYIPAFVSFIINSLAPNQKRNKQDFRNYDYKFFNARSYSYIMRNSNCLPYFCKNMEFSPEKLKSFYGLFTETKDYPLIELIVSQYCIDYYFSVYLFSETFNFLRNEMKQPSLSRYFSSKDDYGFYLECFLSLCALLQNASGMYTKHKLFHEIHKIFFGSERTKWQKLYSSPKSRRNFIECFNQCAYEFVFYNELIYPYIQKLYCKKFITLLENNYSNLTSPDIYKQLSNIISANINETAYRKNMSVPIKDLEDYSLLLKPESENKILNYTFNMFYNHVPFYPNPFILDYVINSDSPYHDLMINITPKADSAFISIKANYYSKNARFLI